MSSREKIIEADDFVEELREWLRERGRVMERLALASDGESLNIKISRIPENGSLTNNKFYGK